MNGLGRSKDTSFLLEIWLKINVSTNEFKNMFFYCFDDRRNLVSSYFVYFFFPFAIYALQVL